MRNNADHEQYATNIKSIKNIKNYFILLKYNKLNRWQFLFFLKTNTASNITQCFFIIQISFKKIIINTVKATNVFYRKKFNISKQNFSKEKKYILKKYMRHLFEKVILRRNE